MTKEKEARALLIEHFPNAGDGKIDFWAYFFSTGMLTSGIGVDVVEKKAELARLEKVEKLMKCLWKEYSALTMSVHGFDSWRLLWQLHYELIGVAPLRKPHSSPPKVGEIETRRKAVEASNSLHHNQRESQFKRKVGLIQDARECWKHLAGEEPPISPSGGSPFFKFVTDLITFSKKEWGPEKCFAAWRKYDLM